jgi:cytochrome c oxidase subunit III
MSTERRVIDVSGLPSSAIGAREPLWWGIVMMCAIEATMLALLIVAYGYIRGEQSVWPPTPIGRTTLIWGSAAVACWLASAWPIVRTSRACHAKSLGGMRRGLIVATVLGAAALVFRALEIDSVHFQWDSHAHGSLYFTIIGFHTMHAIIDLVENLILIALLYKGPVEEKHANDVYVNCVYWYFIVGTGLAVWAVIYLDAFLLPKG